MPGSTHPALFCIHLLSSAGCRLPGVLAAQPAPLGPGEQLLQAGGGRDDVPFTWQSLGNGSAAAGLEHWRCECVQVERTARDCSGRHPGGSCWKEADGCRGAVATGAPPMPWLWAHYKEQSRNIFYSFLFPQLRCRPHSGPYLLSALCAQADWPLEGSCLPMEPPRTAGSTLPLWDQSHVSEAPLVTP